MPASTRARRATRSPAQSSSIGSVKCATGASRAKPIALSGLNFLVAAIILWNTVYLERAFAELRRQGRDVRPELAKHVAPLGWEHIGLTGDYVLEQRRSTGRWIVSAAAAQGINARSLSCLFVLTNRTICALSCRHPSKSVLNSNSHSASTALVMTRCDAAPDRAVRPLAEKFSLFVRLVQEKGRVRSVPIGRWRAGEDKDENFSRWIVYLEKPFKTSTLAALWGFLPFLAAQSLLQMLLAGRQRLRD